MILGIGIDLVQISKYTREVLNPDPADYLQRHFSFREIEIVESRQTLNKEQLYAARWAAKEAFVKAMNGADLFQEKLWIGWVDFREIQILSDVHERPYLELTGKVKELAGQRNVKSSHLSLSHEGDYATAFVILES